MSHFSVAVFSRTPGDVEELLAPFIEQVDADSPYAEFVESTDCDFDEDAKAKGYWRNPNARWDWWESRRALARPAQAASGQERLHCAAGSLAQRFRLSAALLRRGAGRRLRFFAARGADPAGGAPVGSGRGGRCAARRRGVLQPLEAGILSGSLRGQGDLHPPGVGVQHVCLRHGGGRMA